MTAVTFNLDTKTTTEDLGNAEEFYDWLENHINNNYQGSDEYDVTGERGTRGDYKGSSFEDFPADIFDADGSGEVDELFPPSLTERENERRTTNSDIRGDDEGGNGNGSLSNSVPFQEGEIEDYMETAVKEDEVIPVEKQNNAKHTPPVREETDEGHDVSSEVTEDYNTLGDSLSEEYDYDKTKPAKTTTENNQTSTTDKPRNDASLLFIKFTN